ncbi:PREDICTED: uncharacterized protein LOC109207438 [Nicotiana attenuata]|uniref:uncharacterized protein LOC109207438 n=1 Tax=Nicotiana attenuata TaxID=49451 RepID=UPI000905970E|nr:PREDICTED: uncharacterized protein LOC109207438 [Nicotiana attenuata]
MRDGKLVVKIVAEDIKYQEEFWTSTLIGYVLGDTPFARSMDNYVATVWNFVTKPKILYHDKGYYIFKFHTVEDRDLVMHTGLPVGYWSPEALSKLASGVGKPLYTNKFTAELKKISYARALVEADVTQSLPECIEIDTPFGVFQQQEVATKRRRRNRKKPKANGPVWQAKIPNIEQEVQLGVDLGTSQISKGTKGKAIFGETTKHGDHSSRMHDPNPMRMQTVNRFASLRIEEPSTIWGGPSQRKKAGQILQKVAKEWNYCCKYNTSVNGIIWFLWRDHIAIQILAIQEQYIHCSVKDVTYHFSTVLTVVYAKNVLQHMEELWNELQQVGAPISAPWILSGDFNIVLSTEDRIGQPVTITKIQGFQGLLNNLQVTPLRSIGWHFTRCNKQHVTSKVYSKIDWGLGNLYWL